jgi:hypothetical protein
MAETDKPAAAKAIVDVAHPGKSAPSDNSKSVIIGNRPLLKDPMVITDNPAKMLDKVPTKNPSAKIKGPDIATPQSATAPLLETEALDETAEQTIEPAKPASSPEPESTEPESKPEPETELKPKPEKVINPSPAATPPDRVKNDRPPGTDKPETDQPATPEEGDNDKPETADDEGQTLPKDSAQQLEAEAAAKAKHQEAIEKLADSKQYYLPINTVEKRRSRRFVVIGIILSLLLIVAWADIALDAGLIHIQGLKPITHFFSN